MSLEPLDTFADDAAEWWMVADAWGLLDPMYDGPDDYLLFGDDDGPCGCCECCPCDLPGCPVCTFAAPDTGFYGFHAPMTHGGSSRPVVTGDIARARRMVSTRSQAVRTVKRDAHRRNRRAWKGWCRGAGESRLPCVVPGTGWEVW